MTRRYLGTGSCIALLIGAPVAVACGDGFSSDNCQETHTCSVPDAQAGAAGTSADSPDNAAGSPASVGGSAAAAGNSSSNAGAETVGGAGSTVGNICATDQDCSNGDASDGEETCGGGKCVAGNAPPSVKSVTPADKLSSADPDASIVITFSEPLDAATVTAANIKLLDGDTALPGKLSYADGTVTFTPDVPLLMLKSYQVAVAAGVKDVDGAPMLSAFSSTFTTRDGAWKTIDAVKLGAVDAKAAAITATGSVLVSWNGKSGGACPVSAQWFRFAGNTGPVQSFDPNDSDCAELSASANAAGVATVAWQVPSASAGDLAQQFRNGAWAAAPAVVSSAFTDGNFRVAVSPTGMMTLFATSWYGLATTAWHTDTTGKWIAKGDVVSKTHNYDIYPVIRFDAAGNGLAVWRDTVSDVYQILYSRFTVASGKWSVAAIVPNSKAATSGNERTPALAMSATGDAAAIWIEEAKDGSAQVKASSFSHATGWAADAQAVSSVLNGSQLLGTPTIVHDGQAFVAAWYGDPKGQVGVCAGAQCTYTSRLESGTAQWSTPGPQQTTATNLSALGMPGLASDGRGNLMLVWAIPTNQESAYSLVYQRYVAGKWSAIQPVPGGAIGGDVLQPRGFTLSMNASGMAALSWNMWGPTSIDSVRLASFY